MIPLLSGRRNHALKDPFFSSVILLLHGDGTNGGTVITDSSSKNKTASNSGYKTSTVQSKFGSSSLTGSTTSSTFSYGADTDFALGTADFTIEFFAFLVSGSNQDFMTSAFDNTAGHLGFNIYFGGKTAFGIGNSTIAVLTNNLGTGVWVHIAFTRASGVFRAFNDGVAGDVLTPASQNLIAGNMIIGVTPWTGSNLGNFMDEIRITKGVARYTGAFTPPSAPFPNH